MIEAGDIVIQIQGPRAGCEFIVGDVDGNLLHVKPRVHHDGEDRNYHWSHRDYYRELTPRERGDVVWHNNLGWVAN